MKVVKSLAAVALFVITYSTGMAQNSSIPAFNTDAEKQSWIESNSEKYSEMLQSKTEVNQPRVSSAKINQSEVKKLTRQQMMLQAKRAEKATPSSRVISNERFGSDAEKKRWKDQQIK